MVENIGPNPGSLYIRIREQLFPATSSYVELEEKIKGALKREIKKE